MDNNNSIGLGHPALSISDEDNNRQMRQSTDNNTIRIHIQNNSSPSFPSVSSELKEREDEIHWLHFSIPFEQYQKLLQPNNPFPTSSLMIENRSPSLPPTSSQQQPSLFHSIPLRPNDDISSSTDLTMMSIIKSSSLQPCTCRSCPVHSSNVLSKSVHLLSPSHDRKVTPINEINTSVNGTDKELESSLSNIQMNRIQTKLRQGGRKHRPRGSIFAGKGTYIDTEKSVMQFPVRAFRPLIGRRWWNRFMFHRSMRQWFIWITILLVVCSATSILTLDFTSNSRMFFMLISFCFCLIPTILMITHWLDVKLLMEVLLRWESILSIAYIILLVATGIVNSSFQPTESRWLRLLSTCISNICSAMGLLFVICSDACPRTLFSRKSQMIAYCVITLGAGYTWVRHGILPSEPNYNLPSLCIYGCLSSQDLYAMAASNLSMFAFKHFLSLLFWPRAAVVLKSMITVER